MIWYRVLGYVWIYAERKTNAKGKEETEKEKQGSVGRQKANDQRSPAVGNINKQLCHRIVIIKSEDRLTDTAPTRYSTSK